MLYVSELWAGPLRFQPFLRVEGSIREDQAVDWQVRVDYFGFGRLETYMQSTYPPKVSIGKRATEELKEFVVIAAYLYVCFTAILYLKASILRAYGIEFAPFGFAAVKAAICAKFVSVGHMLRVGERFKSRPLIWPTLYKSFAFLILLLVLNALEEIVAGLIHHRAITDSLAEFGGGTLDQLIATSILCLLILIPFFAFRTLGEVLGERNLVRLFFEPRPVTRIKSGTDSSLST